MKVFGFTGPSGSGKTTIIENILPHLLRKGLTVSVIKHAHHGFDIDKPGKDSWRQREAGAKEVLLSSDMRWVLMHELCGSAEPELPEQLQRLSPCDLVLVEGFKRQPVPKLEVYRLAKNTPPLYPTDTTIVALATDGKLETDLPSFQLSDYTGIANFIVQHLALDQIAAPPQRRT